MILHSPKIQSKSTAIGYVLHSWLAIVAKYDALTKSLW